MIKQIFYATVSDDLTLKYLNIAKFKNHLLKLKGKTVAVTCEERKKHRSNEQNAYYWGVVLKTKADYAIENNSAISREHCIVIQRDGVNYIKDNNSTNHTYVNGVELQPGKEVLLKHKTEVRLGDEEFTFLLRKGE